MAIKKYYHATTEQNMKKIVADREIRKSWDGIVYLCDQPLDACKFLLVRGITKMCVIEVCIPESKVQLSCDHSISFFECEAFVHKGSIKLTGKEKVFEYEFESKNQEARK